MPKDSFWFKILESDPEDVPFMNSAQYYENMQSNSNTKRKFSNSPEVSLANILSCTSLSSNTTPTLSNLAGHTIRSSWQYN